jgi:hypothetical protein
MIRAAAHALVCASGHKVEANDPTFSVIALQIGGIEQQRCAEDSRAADHGRADVGRS